MAVCPGDEQRQLGPAWNDHGWSTLPSAPLLVTPDANRLHHTDLAPSVYARTMQLSTFTIAADLVPWWFAAAFWIAFAGLVFVIGRDVRRLGGARQVTRALREAVTSQGDDRPSDPEQPTHR